MQPSFILTLRCFSYRSDSSWQALPKKQANLRCYWKNTRQRWHQCPSSLGGIQTATLFVNAKFWTALGTCLPHNCCAHTLHIVANWKRGMHVRRVVETNECCCLREYTVCYNVNMRVVGTWLRLSKFMFCGLRLSTISLSLAPRRNAKYWTSTQRRGSKVCTDTSLPARAQESA